MGTKVKRKTEQNYKPVELRPMGQKLYDLSQELPGVVFDAPPDYQDKFREHYAEQMADKEYDHARHLGMSGYLFYEGKPIREFFDPVEEGTLIMLLMGGKKDVDLVTVIVKVGELYKDGSIPQNYRIDFHQTGGFKKNVGGGNVWSGHILAAAIVDGLSKEMAILDPEAEIFAKKARKYAVTLEEYHQRNFRIEVVPGRQVLTVGFSDGLTMDRIYQVVSVRGRELLIPGSEIKIVPGILVSGSLLGKLEQLGLKGEVVYQKKRP